MQLLTETKDGKDIDVLHFDVADVESMIQRFILKCFPDYAQGHEIRVSPVVDGHGEYRAKIEKA